VGAVSLLLGGVTAMGMVWLLRREAAVAI
jgi:hypothetical protein